MHLCAQSVPFSPFYFSGNIYTGQNAEGKAKKPVALGKMLRATGGDSERGIPKPISS